MPPLQVNQATLPLSAVTLTIVDCTVRGSLHQRHIKIGTAGLAALSSLRPWCSHPFFLQPVSLFLISGLSEYQSKFPSSHSDGSLKLTPAIQAFSDN